MTHRENRRVRQFLCRNLQSTYIVQLIQLVTNAVRDTPAVFEYYRDPVLNIRTLYSSALET